MNINFWYEFSYELIFYKFIGEFMVLYIKYSEADQYNQPKHW